MAKKKPTQQRESTRNPEGADKTRFELRFDNSVYDKLKQLADSTGISINQLMQALARWGVSNLQPGEPTRDGNGFVTVNPQKGCLWAGRLGRFVKMTPEELRDEWTYNFAPPEGADLKKDTSEYGRGEVYTFLDFTERRVVRDDV